MGVRALFLMGLMGIVCIPGLAYARSQKVKFSRAPQVVEPKNSQTMTLLEGRGASTPTAVNPHLAIVDNSALSAEADSGEAFIDGVKSGGQISVYIVRKGDSLPSIAKMFDVSTKTIIWANDLKSNSVKEGQELVILPISGVRHIVKKGDTIQSIAKKYKADVGDILAYNNLSADTKLATGDEIIVPDGEITAPVSTTKPSSGGGLPAIAGYFMKPINAVKTQGLHGHNGIDFGAAIGTPVFASANGTVILAKIGGYNGGYGTYVVVSHPNGTQTLYAHLSAVYVNVGQTVSQGKAIAASGNSGKSTGPHLHFEIRGAKNPF